MAVNDSYSAWNFGRFEYFPDTVLEFCIEDVEGNSRKVCERLDTRYDRWEREYVNLYKRKKKGS
ncbi:hypothetical protein HOD75_04010 [archaeon]|jgi:hypothetical protein|nr:hypothetical protein [Candidatus Woesearchaeota archaeon]MBT4135672.1 hypothetical protein [archaeon]MBT4242033.1 hypothetical protein [archaeon]MBT4417720.1 hypothetical protein [archaeon]